MKIYRIVLIIILIAVIGGGAWYCFYASKDSKTPAEGTLVEKCIKKCGSIWA